MVIYGDGVARRVNLPVVRIVELSLNAHAQIGRALPQTGYFPRGNLGLQFGQGPDAAQGLE
jgi:hypothetical protein